jgi:hypothetical protein
MTPGERVAATALRYVGVRESPDGSNRGPLIDKWAAHWGLQGVPWCGCYVDAMFREAGVGDADLAHPSTSEMRRRANAAGAIIPSSARAPAGAFWLNDPNHVGLVVSDRGDGTVNTVEGNTSNGVFQRIRRKSDARIVVPPGIAVEPDPPKVTEYLLEDPKAEPKLYGPWRSKKNRDAALASLPARRRSSARLVRGKDGGYGFILGPRRLYGPWPTKEARDDAQRILEKRIGRRLRPFSRKVSA